MPRNFGSWTIQRLGKGQLLVPFALTRAAFKVSFLDDGASNYHIYNNLCVGVSMKLREGASNREQLPIFPKNG